MTTRTNRCPNCGCFMRTIKYTWDQERMTLVKLPKDQWVCVNLRCKKKSMSETKEVRLKDSPFLLQLTGRGMTYQDYGPETVIKVAACAGDYGDWTAYYETPTTPFGNVLKYGNKLPEQVAKELFPEWTKRGLAWRA